MEHKNLKYWRNQKPPVKGKAYTDDLFPPNENSLIGKDSSGNFIDPKEGEAHAKKIDTKVIGWMRCSELFKNQKYLLFENKIEKDDINQGILGDCYFLASVAALTEYPNLIYQMFKTKTINKEGYFEIIFFIDGEFQIVIVDDYIPIDKRTKKEVYARPNKNEIYVCILEKAWAKLNGGYSNIIKGWMHQVLETFTGFPSESHNHTKVKSEVLWNAINYASNKNCILSCSSTKNVESKGLVNSHAYTLIGTYMIKSNGKIIRLVKLRNTWGFGEWNGDWSDNSPLWGEEEKNQVNFVKKDDANLSDVKYKGNFVDGLRKGKGVIYYKNGDRYEGEFDNDVKEGHGIYYFKSGTTWEGPFHDDKMDGEGIFKGKHTRKVTYVKGILKK